MTIAVIGAGAMGALFAGRLAAAGHATTLVEVDPLRQAQIGAQGLMVELAGRAMTLPVPCVAPSALAGGQDLLVIFTKFAALGAALAQARHGLAPGGIVAVLANGLGVAEQLEGLVDPARLVLGVSDVAADVRAGVAHSDGTGLVKIGMARPDCDDAPARTVRSCLARAGFDVHVARDIRGAIWEKVAFNAALNALATLADARVGDLDKAPGRRIVAAVLAEVAAVARAELVAFDQQAVEARIEHAFCHQREHRPSMAQDRRHGRPTEIEAINGAIAARGDRLGVAMPVNQTLADLVRLTGG
jgi:2-dehydropantoate 2-reductase